MQEKLPTTDIERAFWSYDRASVSNITEMARLEGPVSLEALKVSVESVVSRHPCFRHTFSPDGSALIGHARALVDWRVVRDPESWVGEAEEEMHRRFDLTRLPLIRAVVVETKGSTVFLLTLPHVLGAGAGALNCARDILLELDSRMQGEIPAPQPERPFHRPGSHLFDPRRAQAPTWTHAGEDELQAVPPADELSVEGSASSRSFLKTWILSASATERFLGECRALDLPWNALLTAVLLRAADGAQPRKGSWLKLSVAIDFRDMLSEPRLEAADFGMWAGRFNLYARLGGSPPTTLAQALKAGTFQVLRRSAFWEILGMVGKGPGTPQPAFKGLLPHVKITNLGDLDEQGLCPAYRCFQVTVLQSLTALHRGWVGEAGFGLIPSLYQKRLQLSFFSGQPWKDRPAWVHEVLDALGTPAEWVSAG